MCEEFEVQFKITNIKTNNKQVTWDCFKCKRVKLEDTSMNDQPVLSQIYLPGHDSPIYHYK